MDVRKIIDTLLIMAIGFLFSSIFYLNNGIADLSKNIAVRDERAKSVESFLSVQTKTLNKLTELVQQNSKRLDRMEWKDKHASSR